VSSTSRRPRPRASRSRSRSSRASRSAATVWRCERSSRKLAHLGIDPFEDQIGWDRFAAILRSRSTSLKVVLTDQDIIAGIGNIYADEILFAAGLRYDRESESLSTIEIRRLHRAISETLTEAIKHGGSTLDDEQFVDPDGCPARSNSSIRSTTVRASRASSVVHHRASNRSRAQHVLLPEMPVVRTRVSRNIASVVPCFLSD